MKLLLLLIVLAFVLLQLYIRFSPSNPDNWHKAISDQTPGDYPDQGGFLAVRHLEEPAGQFEKLAAIAARTPRTRLLAGKLEEGLLTYETRSKFWGFPDYTTIQLQDASDGTATLSVHARLRFGKSDVGINRKRVRVWLHELEQAS